MAWNEYGPDGSSHLYLRRFSSAGPIDAAPRELASDASGHEIAASLTAAGDTYVIAWATFVPGGSNYVLRRLSATTGSWFDAEPVPLAKAEELVLGSNGQGALAVYSTDCPSQPRCLRARAIATDPGAPLRSNETIPAAIPASGISIASNGHDYLIAWNDNPCPSPCGDVIGFGRSVALRLAADGTALDAAPIVFVERTNYDSEIVWSGGNYLVTWFDGAFILCARVSPSGLTEAAHEVFGVGKFGLTSHHLVANGAGLLLLISQQMRDAVTTSWVAVDPQSLLALGEPEVLITGQPIYATVSAATLPMAVVIAYDRADPAAANVPRVFTRVFGSVKRRHAAR